MPEAKPSWDVRGPNEIETQQLVQGLDRRRFGNGSGSRGQLGLEGVARHRRTFEHKARVVGKQAEFLEQRRHDTLWDECSREVDVRPAVGIRVARSSDRASCSR